MDRLKPDELKLVVEVVENSPECFPQGTLPLLGTADPRRLPVTTAWPRAVVRKVHDASC